VGLDVPAEAEKNGIMEKFLKDFGYVYVEETQNSVYQHFLR
jgi:hypothetical protein